MDEDVKKEFETIREEMQNQYQDAIGSLYQEMADFKTSISESIAELTTREQEVLEGHHQRLNEHVELVASTLEGYEETLKAQNNVIIEEVGKLEKRIEKLEGK